MRRSKALKRQWVLDKQSRRRAGCARLMRALKLIAWCVLVCGRQRRAGPGIRSLCVEVLAFRGDGVFMELCGALEEGGEKLRQQQAESRAQKQNSFLF